MASCFLCRLAGYDANEERFYECAGENGCINQLRVSEVDRLENEKKALEEQIKALKP